MSGTSKEKSEKESAGHSSPCYRTRGILPKFLMKRWKQAGLCLLAGLLILCLASCGGGEKKIDLEALGKDLTASSAFTLDMSQYSVIQEVAASTYRYEAADVETCIMYADPTSGQEIFLAKAASEEAAKQISELCQQRVSDQKAALANYVPEAIPRLDSAILVTKGQYVIFVVANDAAAAQTVVDQYTK